MNDLTLAFHDQLRQRLASGERFSAYVRGPYASGKTTVLAQVVRDAVDGGLELEEIAAFAPTHLRFNRLADVIAAPWPEFETPAAELFPRGQRGVPFDALASHTALEGEAAGTWFDRFAANRWTEFCASTAEFPLSDAFLAKLKPQFKAALKVDRYARLTGAPTPPILYLHGVAAFIAKLKTEWRLIDRVDMLHGGVEASAHVRLLVLDEIAKADVPLLVDIFPRASLVMSGVFEPHEATRPEISLVLSTGRRSPKRFDYECEPEQAPSPGAFASLFVICPRWRRGAWLRWMARHGIPPPRNWRWRQTVEAWGGGQAIGAHAQAVLARYGSLEDLPIVRMDGPNRLRGLEAEIAYVDVGQASKDLADLAFSRATRRIVAIS